jgi:hypothetical protein
VPTAERLEPRRLSDAAGDRDDGVPAERMAGGADKRWINVAAEGFVIEHCIDIFSPRICAEQA